MRDRDATQLKLNNEIIAKMGVKDVPLKVKHTYKSNPKFGGKKKSSGNSGNTGKAFQRKKRARVVSQSNSPEQYAIWNRSVTKATEDKQAKDVQKLSGEKK
jgi:hypothetical protein